MNKDVVRAIALGICGLVVALALTAGAFAIAGQDISEPAGVPMLTVAPSSSRDHEGAEDERSPEPAQTASPSVGDHGDAGSDDAGSTATAGPDDEGSGSGSDDHGGSSGSSDSGSGSNSGSGSSSSGSGSGSDDSGEHGDD